MSQIYVQNFTDKASVLEAYNAPKDALDGATVYLAWYGYGSYDGKSLVIFRKGGKLYEVNGSHCSCNGLENQWEPEETSWAALAKRDLSYSDGCDVANKILKSLVAKHGGK